MAPFKRSGARSSGTLKRYTPSSRRYSRSSRRGSTNYVKRTWPLYSGMSQAWDPFPAKATAIMRYSAVLFIDPSSAIPGHQLFRANSIHDPDFTGIGHQPYGHDTYATIYNHYNVRNCKITMTPTGTADLIYGITLTDDSTVNSNYDTVRELKGTRMAVLSADAGTQSSVVNSFNVNQNFDVPFQKATSASFGASPSESMVFDCWAEAPNSTADPSAMSFLFTLTYTVDIWELKDLGQS